MYCKNCGNQIDENAVVCVYCGCITGRYVQNTKPASSYRNEFYTPILGLIFAFIIPLAGFIISIVQYVRAKKVSGEKKYALCGLILSSLIIGLTILIFFIGIREMVWEGLPGIY